MVRGPKGIITFKGVLLSIEQDFVALQADKGGLLGGKDKKQVTYFSKHGIIGVRLEE